MLLSNLIIIWKKPQLLLKALKSTKFTINEMNNIPLLPKELLNTKAENRKDAKVVRTFNIWARITNNFKLSIGLSIVKEQIKNEPVFKEMQAKDICYDFKKARQKHQRDIRR